MTLNADMEVTQQENALNKLLSEICFFISRLVNHIESINITYYNVLPQLYCYKSKYFTLKKVTLDALF